MPGWVPWSQPLEAEAVKSLWVQANSRTARAIERPCLKSQTQRETDNVFHKEEPNAARVHVLSNDVCSSMLLYRGQEDSCMPWSLSWPHTSVSLAPGFCPVSIPSSRNKRWCSCYQIIEFKGTFFFSSAFQRKRGALWKVWLCWKCFKM